MKLNWLFSISIVLVVLYVGVIVLNEFSIKAEKINMLCNESDIGIVYYEGEKLNCSDWIFNESINAIGCQLMCQQLL